jgi:hypothetical protein
VFEMLLVGDLRMVMAVDEGKRRSGSAPRPPFFEDMPRPFAVLQVRMS